MAIEAAHSSLVAYQIYTHDDYQVNWHHRVIGQELDHILEHGDRDYKILILSVPPRHGKSQQATIDFAPYALGRDPDLEFIAATYSAELTQDFSFKAREKFGSEEHSDVFPGMRVNPDMATKAKWGVQVFDEEADKWITKKGSYTAVGVGGPITGRGARIFVIDDPVKNREEAESEVYREKIWQWFTSTAFTRLEPGGVMIVIQTRWHMDDLTGRILAHPEMKKMTKVIKFPAISTSEEEFRPADFPLWPKKYPRQALENIKKTVGPYDWSSLYQQSPILTENQEFKPEWRKDITEAEVDRIRTRRFLLIDSATKDTATADRTGFSDVRMDKDGFWYVSSWGSKMGPEDLADQMFTLYKNNRYELIGIEETTYVLGFKAYLDNEMRRRGVHLPIVMLKHGGTNKNVRIRGLIPFYSAGSIFHITGQCTHLEEELDTFPLGKTDDVVDSLAYMPQVISDHMVDDSQGGVHSYKPRGR